jgi:hypothetical protein
MLIPDQMTGTLLSCYLNAAELASTALRPHATAACANGVWASARASPGDVKHVSRRERGAPRRRTAKPTDRRWTSSFVSAVNDSNSAFYWSVLSLKG